MFRATDPYAAQRRLTLRNLWLQTREQPGEILLYAFAVVVAAALLASMLWAQAANLGRGLRWLFAEHLLLSLIGLAALAATDHYRQRRRQRREWAGDWLAAQPIPHGMRGRRRWRDAGMRLFLQMLAAGITLGAGGLVSRIPVAALSLTMAAFAGQWSADFDWRPRLRPAARETPYLNLRRGRLWRWQAIEATASLAPRRLSWLLLSIVLIPQGIRLMVVVALVIIALLAAVHAWQRSLWVVSLAQRWMMEQPLPPRFWLLRCLPLPLALLFGICGTITIAATLFGDSALLFVALVMLPALGLLQLAVAIAERRHPRFAALSFALHALLLLTVLQALLPAAAAVWLLQMLFLIRRGLR